MRPALLRWLPPALQLHPSLSAPRTSPGPLIAGALPLLFQPAACALLPESLFGSLRTYRGKPRCHTMGTSRLLPLICHLSLSRDIQGRSDTFLLLMRPFVKLFLLVFRAFLR